MSKLVLEIDEEKFDELLVIRLKEHASILRKDAVRLSHVEDIMNAIQTHSAILRVIQYWTVPSDFNKFMEKQYGSKSAQGE
jgi:hypothetical protein